MINRNKKSILKSRRGDISTPLITVLIIIASVAIAAVLIAWMYGVGLTASSQSQVIVLGTPVLRPAQDLNMSLTIIIRVAGNVPVLLMNATITVNGTTYYMYVSNTAPVYINDNTVNSMPYSLNPGISYTIRIPQFRAGSVFLNTTHVTAFPVVYGTLETSAGPVNFAAQVMLA